MRKSVPWQDFLYLTRISVPWRENLNRRCSGPWPSFCGTICLINKKNVPKYFRQNTGKKSILRVCILRERGEMHGLIGQKRLFSRLFDICGQNCNMENVHSTTRNIYSHWKTSFTELIAIFINSKFVSFCLCWLEGFTHLVCRFFYRIKKITVEVTAGAPSLSMHFDVSGTVVLFSLFP